MIRGHIIQLSPNLEQRDYFARAAGVARFAYNWALDAWRDIYAVHTVDPTVPNTSEMELRRGLNALKKGLATRLASVISAASAGVLRTHSYTGVP